MENGNKKTSVLTSLWVCQSSSVLGSKLSNLKTFYGWVARVTTVCIHVHPGIVIRRKEVCRSSSLSHHTQLTGAAHRGRTTLSLQELCAGNCRSMRTGVEAHGEYHPFACGWQAGCLAVETMHLPGQTFCCVRKRADHRKHSVVEPVREVCTDQRWSKSSPGVSDTLGMHRLRLECG